MQFRVATAPAPGAIAVIDLFGDVDSALKLFKIQLIEPGAVVVRDIGGIDTGVVVRWRDDHVQLLPHAGPHVVRAIAERLRDHGAMEVISPDPRIAFPEARDLVEACMLETLGRAASPAAIDLLLKQPERWRKAQRSGVNSEEQRVRSAALDRLVAPPLVVAIGPPNVGKSTLTNAMAREAVSVVADQPGTTRDHVGVTLELPSLAGGITLRWIDAPGFRSDDDADPIEREAIRLARAVVSQADLVLSCGDAAHGFLEPHVFDSGIGCPVLRVGLRSDLGRAPACDVTTAASRSEGVTELAETIRQMLIPDDALKWQGPWQFHPTLAEAPTRAG